MNVEGKLSKVLGKRSDTLVVTAGDREKVLNEISARIARYERFDPETADELRTLRENVKDVFNKGQDPGDDILDQLYFLEPGTRDLVEKLSMSYENIVTPDDFKGIAKIMSEHLAEQVPILKDFTKFFGRLAQDFLTNAKPSNAAIDWKTVAKITIFGSKKKGYTLPNSVSQLFGLKAGEPVSEKLLKQFSFWHPKGVLSELLYGVESPEDRAVGKKVYSIDFGKAADVIPSLKKGKIEATLAYADKNDLPKSWTNVPWVNFDGNVIEQNFTQSFEERLVYKDKEGNWTTNILMVPQKTQATWWEEFFNKEGKINDIADATKARTAFAVNGNHSNDAVIVKKFHLWGKKNNISTSTIHDAFFTNIADLLKGRTALRNIYAQTLKKNVVKATLDEMLKRGLPKEIYNAYLQEAIEKGLIPIAGKSRVGDKLLEEADILKESDITIEVPYDFEENYGWYGVG